LIEHGIDGKAIQLMLDIDGKDVTKPYLLSKIDELGINSDRVPSNANKIQKAVFYRGVFEAWYGYLFPIFCSIEMKNDERVACFALKPGVREKFSGRLERLNKPTESFVI
jgi:AAA+ ATPase superfamily predicted ATPase